MKMELYRRIFVFGGLVILLLTLCGCEMTPPPPPDGRLQIESVAKWYMLYRNRTGKPPKTEEKFLAFVEKELKSRGDTFDRDEFLTSLRDGQEFQINYGSKIRDFEKNVAVYEQEGYDGKKLVAFESARSFEVEQEKLDALLAGEEF